MINAVRTLLLNRNGDAVVPDWAIGEELVPEGYAAPTLPTYLTTIRSLLFGTNPDRSFQNYRLAQYMALISATELQEHVLSKDPRITYPGNQAALFTSSAFTPASASTGPALTIQGTPEPPDITGRGYYSFQVTTVDSSHVRIQQSQPSVQEDVFNYSLSGGLSAQPLYLYDSGYRFFLPTSDAATTWTITFHNRPQRDPGQILANLKLLSEPVLLQLFDAAPVEPYLTFRNLFEKHQELPYALGGLLLAVAWRTDEVRQGVPRG